MVEIPVLIVPSWIANGRLINELKPCYIGIQFYQYGSPVMVANTVNEFYSVEGFDWAIGSQIVIYWNQ